MNLEWLAITVAVLCGALVLVGLYLLALRIVARSGGSAFALFVRCLSIFSLMHGLGLCLVTGVVLSGADLVLGPIPEEDRLWMERFILAGLPFVLVGGVGLWFTRRSIATARPERGTC
jgi:hypothetical protein